MSLGSQVILLVEAVRPVWVLSMCGEGYWQEGWREKKAMEHKGRHGTGLLRSRALFRDRKTLQEGAERPDVRAGAKLSVCVSGPSAPPRGTGREHPPGRGRQTAQPEAPCFPDLPSWALAGGHLLPARPLPSC